MTCDICGSRDCFDRAMVRTPLPKESIEAEWKRGKASYEQVTSK